MLLSVTAACQAMRHFAWKYSKSQHACRECSPLFMLRSDRSDYFITLVFNKEWKKKKKKEKFI